MPQKPGIFTRYQSEILELLDDDSGYTEIAKILYEKHGVKTTKQNLGKSHKRYLEKESQTARKLTKKKGRKNAPETPLSGDLKCEGKAAQKKSETMPNLDAVRRQKAALYLEFKALLERELVTGRFLDSEAGHLERWGKLLFTLHATTCVDVFHACHGNDFSTYEQAILEAINTISNEHLYESEKTFDPTPEEVVKYLCSFCNEEGEETTLADRFPNIGDAYKAARKEADEERERLGDEGYISL